MEPLILITSLSNLSWAFVVTNVAPIPAFTVAKFIVPSFKYNFLERTSVHLFCLSSVELLPSVMESPKHTTAFLVG